MCNSLSKNITKAHAINNLEYVISFCINMNKRIHSYEKQGTKNVQDTEIHISELYHSILREVYSVANSLVDNYYNQAKLKNIVHHTIYDNPNVTISTDEKNRLYCMVNNQKHLLTYKDLTAIVTAFHYSLVVNLNIWTSTYTKLDLRKQAIWKHTVKLLRQHFSHVHLLYQEAIVSKTEHNLTVSYVDNHSAHWTGSINVNGLIEYPIINKRASKKDDKGYNYIPEDFLKIACWQHKHLNDLYLNDLWEETVQKFHQLIKAPNAMHALANTNVSFKPDFKHATKIHISLPLYADFLVICKGNKIPSDYGHGFPSPIKNILNWYRKIYSQIEQPKIYPVARDRFKNLVSYNDTDTKQPVHMKPGTISKCIRIANTDSTVKQDIHRLATDYGKQVTKKLEHKLDKQYLQ